MAARPRAYDGISGGRSTLTRMPLLRRVVPIALVVGLVSACGGSGVEPAAWAKSVCTALSPWRTRLATLTDQTQRQLTSTTTPAQTKQNLVGLLDGAATASETARRKVAGAGTPDVDHGDEIAARF